MTVRFESRVEDPVIGIMIRTRIGMEVYGTNTELEKLKLGPCEAGTSAPSPSSLSATCARSFTQSQQHRTIRTASWHDWMEDAVSVSVADTRYTAGVANLRARVTCSRG